MVVLTVTSLSEKSSDCEMTLSLSQDSKRDISKPGVERGDIQGKWLILQGEAGFATLEGLLHTL